MRLAVGGAAAQNGARRVMPDHLVPPSVKDAGTQASQHRLIDYLYAFVGVLDLDGALIEANATAINSLPPDKRNVVGKKFWDTHWWNYSKDVSAQLKAACARARTGETVRYDVKVRVLDDHYIWIDFQLSPRFDADGNILNLIPSGMDITERKTVEEALRVSRERKGILLSLMQAQRNEQDTDQILYAAAEAVGMHLGANRVGFFEMANEDTLNFGPCWTDGALEPLSGLFPATGIGEEYVKRVRNGETLAITDVEYDPLTAGSQFGDIGVKSLIGAPIMRQGAWHGGLYVNHADIREWTEEERLFVREVADQTWDSIERTRAQQVVQDRNAQIRNLLNATTEGIYGLDLDGRCTFANQACAEILGFQSPDELIGKVMHDLMHHHHADGSVYTLQSCKIYQSFKTGKRVHIDDELLWRRDGTSFAGEYWSNPIHKNGKTVGAVVTFMDISKRKETEEHREILIGELNHRVKNLLATIKAIASQTMRTTENMETFEEAFIGRLQAVSSAHDILVSKEKERASLSELIVRQIEPYAKMQGGRVNLEGPRIILGPAVAHALGLVLHELATNAVKYGALSNETGRIDIRWARRSINDRKGVEISWAEQGGPPVEKPTRTGFGSRLINMMLSHSLGGKSEIKFDRDGLKATLLAPVAVSVKASETL